MKAQKLKGNFWLPKSKAFCGTSKVAFVKNIQSKEGVFAAVKRAMELAGWRKYVKGKKIFLKINAMNIKLIPGTNTSPWVLEAVLVVLRRLNARVYIGDGDLCSHKNVDISADVWGYKKIAEAYGAEFVHLTNDSQKKVNMSGVIGLTSVSEKLAECDCIISLPAIKTHVWSTISGAVKNMFGCLPRERHLLHLQLADALVDLNNYLKPCFAVVDCTVSLEGSGPRTGIPKVCDAIFASRDLVAVDSAGAAFMGFNPEAIKHLRLAGEKGLGNTNFELIGDVRHFVVQHFKRPADTVVTRMHKTLRNSFLEKYFFRTGLFEVLKAMAYSYNMFYWYYFKGRPKAVWIRKNTGYQEEFSNVEKS